MPKVKWVAQPKVNYLAQVFRDYRKASGMTSEDLAKALGCTAPNVRRNLCKPAESWTVGLLLQYCDVLGIPPEVAFKAAAASR